MMNKFDNIAGVILAAGRGTRFASKDVNKVALLLGGKPIIFYGIELLKKLGILDIFVVVGFGKKSVMAALKDYPVRFVEQKEQRGTGDALASVIGYLSLTTQHILVINGDDPFHKLADVECFIEQHVLVDAAVTFSTTKLTNPTGMGRIVRDRQGNVGAIVEEKDTTKEQKKIKEVNGACYIFTVDFLKTYLPKLAKSEVTGEYYITALIALAAKNDEKIETVTVEGKGKGINTPGDLKEAEKLLSP